MNPIAQKASGLGAVIGFALTFVLGSPVSGEGALKLVLHSVLAGLIFGALGFVMGDLFHRFISEKLTMRIDAIILEKEMKRQEKLRRAQEQLEKLRAAGMTPPEVEFLPDMNMASAVGGEESPAGI
jgi:phosphate/sulfate permease